MLEESVVKFSDSLIASTSSNADEISFWEPKTLAPYEPLIVRDDLYSLVIRIKSFMLLLIHCKLIQHHISLGLISLKLWLIYGDGIRKNQYRDFHLKRN